jgi:membrane dipeptidase
MNIKTHPSTAEATAQRAMQSVAVWDNHACLPMDLSANARFLPEILRYRAAGVSILSLNIGYGEMSLDDHIRLIAQMRRWVRDHHHDCRLITTVDDIDAARAAGQLGITFDIEGAAPLASQIDLVDLFHDLGVRWMLLAYNRRNPFASGVHDGWDDGLSSDGRALIRRMESVGVVTCLSHTSYRAACEAISVAERPVIFSHSNPRALCDHPRNIPDDLIRQCAAIGGVVGINGLGLFLGGEGATARRVAEHIDYVVELVGIEHVSLGLDYVFDLEGLNTEKSIMTDTFPPKLGYEQPTTCVPPEAIFDIVRRLADRGYDLPSLQAVLGRNLRRVANSVWR